MGFATHLGPWLLGTTKDTTGTTAATTRNTGSTVVIQNKAITFADTTATNSFALPAGAIVHDVSLYVDTTVFNGTAPTITVKNGSTTVGTITPTTGTAGVYAMTATATTAAVALLANVGANDVFFTHTVSGTSVTTGAGTLVITYSVRGSDGVGYPVGNQN
jgi:hypothetical protein